MAHKLESKIELPKGLLNWMKNRQKYKLTIRDYSVQDEQVDEELMNVHGREIYRKPLRYLNRRNYE